MRSGIIPIMKTPLSGPGVYILSGGSGLFRLGRGLVPLKGGGLNWPLVFFKKASQLGSKLTSAHGRAVLTYGEVAI